MLIFDSEPDSWQDLQTKVGQLFAELGCHVSVGVTVELVRGKKEIDVLVIDSASQPVSTYAVECKHWRASVPQEVAHSFRAVAADLGVHHAFVVSTNGFQSGAYEAVKHTNIHLVSFVELQQIFVDRWLVAMAQRYMPIADALFPYWDPSGGRMPTGEWGDHQQQKLRLLIRAYEPIVDLGPSMEFDGYRMKLPIVIPVLDDNLEEVSMFTISSCRMFYDFIQNNSAIAMQRFRRLYGEE